MAAALDKSLGSTTFNAASTTMALTTSAAAVVNSRVYVFLMWAGSPTLSSVSGGGLAWTVDAQEQSGGFNVAIASADAPAGLASGTTITGTFSASATHGLISAASFTGVPDSTPFRTEVFGNATGTATAAWFAQAMGADDVGGLAVMASTVDNSGNSTPTGDATELHDFSDVNFFGAMVTSYEIIGPNTLARAAGTWSTVSGSLGNNSVAVVRKDNSTPTVPTGSIQKRSRMKARAL